MTRRSVALILAVALCGLMPLVAHAQAPTLNVRATVSASTVTLGEHLDLIVVVQHPADVLVSVEPPTRTAVLALDQVIPVAETPGDDGVNSQFEYVLAAFSLGSVQMPPLRVSWLDADGNTGSVLAKPPPFTVRITSASGDTALRPLKPQMSIGGGPAWWQKTRTFDGVAVAIAVLAIATLGIWRTRARGRRVTSVPAEESSIEGTARARLEALVAAAPLRRGDYDEYYGTIASVIRDYLEERFGFGARALTTTELQHRMVSLGVERWQARLVSGLLDRCDAAVYAGRQPDPASADHDLTIAFEIIELSRQTPELVGIPA